MVCVGDTAAGQGKIAEELNAGEQGSSGRVFRKELMGGGRKRGGRLRA